MVTVEHKKLHILLAEDDADDSLLFTLAADVLTVPVQISLAEDGEMLMKYLDREKKPELIFMDINMPRKNGLECLHEIRASQQYEHLPIVMYSTSSDPNQIETCYQAGAHLYAIKPTSFQTMIKLLKKITLMDFTSFRPRNEFLVTVS